MVILDNMLNSTATYQEFLKLDKYGEATYKEEVDIKVNVSSKKEYIRTGNVQSLKDLDIYYCGIPIKIQSKINNNVVISSKDVNDFRGNFVYCIAITNNLDGVD